MPKADEKADPRRQRRALTAEELTRVLAVAAVRPMTDARTVRRGKRKGESYADLRPETVMRLIRLGRERALIYKTLLLTGLRKGELSSLTVAHLNLEPGPNTFNWRPGTTRTGRETRSRSARISLRTSAGGSTRNLPSSRPNRGKRVSRFRSGFPLIRESWTCRPGWKKSSTGI